MTARCDMLAAAFLELLPGTVFVCCEYDGDTGIAGHMAPGSTFTADIESNGQVRGRVTVLLAPGEETTRDWARALWLAARLVAWQLPPAPEEHENMMNLVTAGEAVGAIIHTVNNHLNAMVIQAACVQLQSEPPLRDQAAVIRREGLVAGANLRHLQAAAPWPARPEEQADLIAAIRHVLDQREFAHLQADLPTDNLPVHASDHGLQRLLTLLFRIVLRWACKKIVVSAQLHQNETRLVLRVPGICTPESSDAVGWDILAPVNPGIHHLEREAARWLIRQTHGNLSTMRQDDSLLFCVLWPGSAK